jgi:Asp-tRNA(Asn)/Glu-tRNA(Gln) amidotransferase A subunit family amidase
MLCQLTAAEARNQIAEGRLTSVDLVKACLDRIMETDRDIGAWAHVDAVGALEQAEQLDTIRRKGNALGALHGVPVGLKDIFDVKGLPTECGTPARKGTVAASDCAVAARLRDAGAVILGKTVTTEFAFLNPAHTANPHNPAHTPGGSSSGSAAAVAAGHVPLAIGTQTNGSVIRPASFCGIFGFKPTRGMISRSGVLQTSVTLDQVGVFGRSLEDVSLLGDALSGYDPHDTASFARPRPSAVAGVRADPPVEPDFAWIDMPYHDRLTADARAGFEEIIETLGGHVERIPAPRTVAELVHHQQVVHEYEIARHLAEDFERHWDLISEKLQAVVQRGRSYPDEQYAESLSMVGGAEKFFAAFFHDYDAILAPSSAGEAPLKAEGTGDPVFCTIWTVAGLPCVNLPLLSGTTGLPVGVQLIGPAERDDRLMRTANWMVKTLATGGEPGL